MEDPTPAAVRDLAAAAGFDLDAETAERVADRFAAQDDLLGALWDPPEPDPPDREWHRPTRETDPLGAFLARCSVEGGSGRLSDLSVGVKDNVAVAGVPMSCGTPAMREFVPARDATVVDRLLSAGATITGKTNMDEFAFGGDASTMRLRLAHNPHDPSRQPGSSSAGSGVAVATGAVDAALGSDTGGSIRFPAAWCGVCGLKPSRGAVSHHGFVNYARTLDCVGVLADDVRTLARVHGAIAGPDPADERTLRAGAGGAAPDAGADAGTEPAVDPDAVLDTDPGELTVGTPDPLFGTAPALDAVVEARLEEFEDAGATVRSVSIPDFDLWLPAWLGLGTTEFARYLDGRGATDGTLAPADPSTVDAVAGALADPDRLGAPVRDAWLYGRRLAAAGNGVHPRAHRARERLTAGVDAALAEVDVLAATTVPMLPPEWGAGIDDVFGALSNTGPFNVTGHPAVSVPAGTVDGLPVGLQFVAPRGADERALGAGAAAVGLGG